MRQRGIDESACPPIRKGAKKPQQDTILCGISGEKSRNVLKERCLPPPQFSGIRLTCNLVRSVIHLIIVIHLINRFYSLLCGIISKSP